jgi:formylglycine-generating enzyme required for sulfatase activity
MHCMKAKAVFALLCCFCGALPISAQTSAAEHMVLIPAGKFWMGRAVTLVVDSINVRARDAYDDVPANNIYLDAFYIDQYEVTNADYAKFLSAKGGKAPWHWPQGTIPKGEEKIPLYNVNWFEATEYCQWAAKRLPTEAEWEKAARGGLDRKIYSWGDDDIDTSEFRRLPPASNATKSRKGPPEAAGSGKVVPVGSFPPNGYGLFDIGGNVSEWVSDWYYDNYYPFMPKKNPPGPDTGLYRSVRGANWASAAGEGHPAHTVNFRNFSDPELRITTIGFRCAKDPN